MKHSKRFSNDQDQAKFLGIILQSMNQPFRLRAGDVIRYKNRFGHVLRVTECAAVVLMRQPPREFTTRFDRHVRLQPKPITFRISPNSEAEILNRRAK